VNEVSGAGDGICSVASGMKALSRHRFSRTRNSSNAFVAQASGRLFGLID
jgi:hypothetical protein